MSILNRIMKLGSNPVVNFTKKGSVKTADVIAKKIDIGHWASNLLRAPHADEFIASTGKQNAKIISDNIVRLSDNVAPYRVITKRLPSGTTIAQAYDVSGPRFKEVISKRSKALSYTGAHAGSYDSCYNGRCVLVNDFVTGSSIYKPMHYPSSKAIYTPANQSVNDGFLSNANGLTAFSNMNNVDYKKLKDMKLVY